MTQMDVRVTARILRTEGGETYTEYIADGVAYGSLSALKAAVGNR
jgi:hypothetical protein